MSSEKLVRPETARYGFLLEQDRVLLEVTPTTTPASSD